MSKKRSSDEVKAEAVRRVVEEGKNPVLVARELGVPREHVQAWLRRKEDFIGERAELNRLRRENEQLKEECEILTKAAAFQEGKGN
jgi:transposase